MRITRNVRRSLQLQKIVFIVLLLTAVGLLGWLSNRHSLQFDWTSNKRNTLSQSSIDLLGTMQDPVLVTVYVQDDETVRAAVEEILQRYQREKKDFSYRLINPDIDFEAAQRDGIERYNQIVVQYNDNKEVISSLSEQTISNINQDIADLEELGINMTPSFFVNGKPLVDFGFGQLRYLVEYLVDPLIAVA